MSDNKFYINEDSQLNVLSGSTITPLDKKARSPGIFFMDENVLCFKNSKDKVFKLFGYEKNELLNDPSIWKPYRFIADITESLGKNHNPLIGSRNGKSVYASEISCISWINGNFSIETFGKNTLEKMVIVREYSSGNKTVTTIDGQELNNFLGLNTPKKKPKI